MNQNPVGSIRIECAAKVNLFLEVLAKRDDGFHEIETLMAAVSLYDSLFFSSNSTKDIQLSCHWAGGLAARTCASGGSVATCLGQLPRQTDNLVWSAIERLRRAADIEQGATVSIVKRIPAMAGLGGASSNAAAALLAANRVWRLNWSRSRLQALAAEIGSDVPFFLAARRRGSAMALARGRGERMEGLTGMSRLNLVVIRPPEGLSTPQVYGRCRPATQAKTLDGLLTALRVGSPARIGAQLFNRLQASAAQMSPWIEKVRGAFEQLDCLGHSMSGSGSSYFGVFRNARHAARNAARLRAARLGYVFTAGTTPVPCRISEFRRQHGK